MPVAISVIICSYNREKYIAEAVLSLIEQDFPKEDYEIIIVDNNSKDNTKEVCTAIIANHRDYAIYYLTELQQGSSFARNTGAASAKGKLLCFMDDDAIANYDFLKNIWKFYTNYPDVGGFGGRIIPRYIPAEPAWMSSWVSSLVGNFNYATNVEEFSPNKYPLESNMIVLKTAFDKINGFNAAIPGVKGSLRIGGEGKDFFMRLKQAGHSVYYVPDIIVEHVVETVKLTSEYMYRVASGIGRGERLRIKQGVLPFLKKYMEYVYKLFGAMLIALGFLVKGEKQKAWPVIQFRIDVLKGYLGK